VKEEEGGGGGGVGVCIKAAATIFVGWEVGCSGRQNTGLEGRASLTM